MERRVRESQIISHIYDLRFMIDMKNPKVSIVLPCYNGAMMIGEAIESIIAQTYKDWELIIVNDCSTDNTLEVVNAYAAKDKRIRVVSNEKNSKLPATLNNGFRKARGEYWTWTSDDNLLLPTMLEEMVGYLDEHPDVGFLVADEDYIDMRGRVLWTHVIPDDVALRLPLNCYIGAAFMYRAEIAKRIGEYREDLFLVEDFEYFLRLNDNCRLAHLPKVLYQYRDNPDSLTATKQKEIAERLCRFRIDYLSKAEAHFKNYPMYMALYYYRIVDNLSGREKWNYYWQFAKKLPFLFGAKYLIVHMPNRLLRKRKGEGEK